MSVNLDLVRSIFVAWERGDFSAADWADPKIEVVLVDGPAPERWSGLAGMAAGWRDFLNAWEGYRVQADDYRDLDDERVLVLISQSARGKTSGVQLTQMHSKAAALFQIRDGNVTRLTRYFDRDRALADLGLAAEE